MWRISEEGNTGTRQKKKTTALRSYCFGADSISEEVVGFLFYGFPKKNSLCLLSLLMCLCLIAVLVIISVKILI